MNEMTIEQARERRNLRLRTMVAGVPLRFRPVIIAGPNDGFIVVDLGFAQKNEFPIVE